MECLLLQGAEVPLCYVSTSPFYLLSLAHRSPQDKFTTDYALPNGDYGTVSNGTLVIPAGVLVNLISGDYEVANGQRGNIYSTATSDKPNTATLPIPTQYTSSGIGSAIPASQLGSSASYTTSPTVTVTAGTVALSTPFSSDISLSGPAVTPCSTCCVECGRPSTTVNATMPTTMPSGSGTFPGYATGTGNATVTPPIIIGAGARIDSSLLIASGMITAALVVEATLFILLR